MSNNIKCRAKKPRNYYKLLHDTVLSILLGISLACAVIPFIYDGADNDFYFMVSKTGWVAGITIILTIMFTYTDEQKEVLK